MIINTWNSVPRLEKMVSSIEGLHDVLDLNESSVSVTYFIDL